jgi:hypothetical protein
MAVEFRAQRADFLGKPLGMLRDGSFAVFRLKNCDWNADESGLRELSRIFFGSVEVDTPNREYYLVFYVYRFA